MPSAPTLHATSPTPAASSESSTLTNTSYSTNLVCADILKILSQSQSFSSQISSNLADLKNINNKVINNESCSPTYSDILKSTYKNKPSTNLNNIIPSIVSNKCTNLPSECTHSIVIEHVSQSNRKNSYIYKIFE